MKGREEWRARGVKAQQELLKWMHPRANTSDFGSDAESEKVDKVRSALGVCYKPELHFAIGHMRRWDGAYQPLANGTKAVDLLQTDDDICSKFT